MAFPASWTGAGGTVGDIRLEISKQKASRSRHRIWGGTTMDIRFEISEKNGAVKTCAEGTLERHCRTVELLQQTVVGVSASGRFKARGLGG